MTIEPSYWPQIISAITGLGGAVIGAGATLLSQWLAWRRDLSSKRHALATAIAAEIEAHLLLVQRRDWIESAKRLEQVGRSGQNITLEWFGKGEAERNPFPILTTHLVDVGVLGALCGRLSAFYSSVLAVRQTVMNFQDGLYSSITPTAQADIIASEIVFWRETVSKGETLVKDLRRLR